MTTKPLKLSVQTLADLTGLSMPQAVRWLERDGFAFHHATRGGYREFRHADGCIVWVRPSGEIVRLGPRVTPSAGGKKYRPRYDRSGRKTAAHSSAEVLAL